MTQKEKMLAGELYIAADEELRAEFMNCRRITRQFNQTDETEGEKREELIKELFEKCGKNVYIEPPFRCDYGNNISVGDNFYANFDCIMLDVNKIKIGNNVFLAPRVCLYTAAHPIDAKTRNTLLEFGKEIIIGNDVWIGGNVVVNPGVKIGNNVVIGSGSVVVSDIPDNCVAVGNPCKVIRYLNENGE